MRNFFCAFGETSALFSEMSEARLRRRFAGASIEPLHTDTNAKEGNAARNGRSNRSSEAGRVESVGGRKVAYSGKHDALGRFDKRKIAVGHHRLRAQMAQGLEDRGEVARLIIDHGYVHHNNPLVEGSILPNCLSREQATRSARAKALKMASILWWLERPYIVLTWTLARAPRAKPSKKSVTSSVCRSPTRRVRTLVSTANAARPLRSIAATARVSSMGMRKYPARRIPRLSPRARWKASPSAMPTSSTVWC